MHVHIFNFQGTNLAFKDLKNRCKSNIQEEMKVKEVEFRVDQALLEYNLTLNFSVAGPKLGRFVNEVKKRVAELDEGSKVKFMQEKELQLTLVSGEAASLSLDDIIVEKKGKNGRSEERRVGK